MCSCLRQQQVLWRSGAILRLCSQNSQEGGGWVRFSVGPHHLSVMTRDHRLDKRLATPAILVLGAKNRNFTFTAIPSRWQSNCGIEQLICVVYCFKGGINYGLSMVVLLEEGGHLLCSGIELFFGSANATETA